MSNPFRMRTYTNSFLEKGGNPDSTMGGASIAASGTGGLTIEAWIYLPAGNTPGGMFGLRNVAVSSQGFVLLGAGADLYVTTDGTQHVLLAGYCSARQNVWVHNVITLDPADGKVHLYENGVEIANVAAAWNIAFTMAFFVGTIQNVTFGTTNMRLVDCRAYARALTAKEAADRYYDARSDAAMNTGLLGVWLFSEGSGTTAADSSGNARPLTLANAAAWVSSGPTFQVTLPLSSRGGPGLFLGRPNWSFSAAATADRSN